MNFSVTKLFLFLALFGIFAVRAEKSQGISTDSTFVEAKSYGPAGSLKSDSGSSATFSTGSVSSEDSPDDFSSSFLATDSTPEEPLPPSASAIASIGPLLSLIQPILGGIFNGQSEENGATYTPILKPLFSPLPILPGFGVFPASLAAQGSDLIASAAASARKMFAKAARENALRSQVNYGHILTAINELNMPVEDEVDSRK